MCQEQNVIDPAGSEWRLRGPQYLMKRTAGDVVSMCKYGDGERTETSTNDRDVLENTPRGRGTRKPAVRRGLANTILRASGSRRSSSETTV